MKFIRLLIISLLLFSYYIGNTYANINLTVSPIKYEIQANTWSIITKTATLYNKSTQTQTITTWKSDFQSSWTTWNPQFVRKSELVFPDQELSSRINIDTSLFTIAPWEKKDINFTITVPDNATPGWHYAWIFFKKGSAESSSWNIVSINVDYWVLILVNIEWKIIENWDLWNTTVISSWWGGWWNILKKDDCVIDLSSSYYDWKCVDAFWIYWDISKNVDKINNLDASDKKLSDLDNSNFNDPDFNISFETLFSNDWNTHLKPTWKITLIDEDWKEIKWVWKELVKNSWGSIIWAKVVDYIPINDNEGNVLPYTKRQFNSEWKWFPYEAYDENWKQIIKYWTPEEYYTRKNVEERWFILPWERVNERINHKKINANIELWYVNRKWENVEFNSAKEFYVDYKEKYIWLNPYFFIWAWILLFIFFFFWLIFRKKKIKCISCSKKIDKDMKVCPYCGKKQTSIFKKKKS
jgi:hypothetical protein